MSAMSTFTPLCATLSTGILYTISGSVTGNAHCYHFNVPNESKTTALLMNIAANNDMRLTVYKHEANDSLSFVGQSDNAGNLNEEVIAITESGNYYWYMKSISADGSSFSFATVLNTSFDEYELNDTVSLSTELPDKFNKVLGNMDSSNDVDYYSFTALRGQDIRFDLINEIGNNHDEWLLDYYNGAAWQRLSTGVNGIYELNGIPVGHTIHVRVSPNPIYLVNPNNYYRLSIGSTVRAMTSHSVTGESTVLRVPLSASHTYLTTQAYNNITWSASLADSTGHPLEGGSVSFNYWLTNPGVITDMLVETDSNGYASGVANLGGCYGNYTSLEHYTYNNGVKSWWTTSYAYGAWSIQIPNAFIDDDLGITYVSIGHLCNHNYIGSE